MRPFRRSMFDEWVFIKRVVDGSDVDGGPVDTDDVVEGPFVQCYVRTTNTQYGDVEDDSVTITNYIVYFPDYPDVHKGYKIIRSIYAPHLRPLKPGETVPPDEAKYLPEGYIEVEYITRELLVLSDARPIGQVTSDVRQRERGNSFTSLWSVPCKMTV